MYSYLSQFPLLVEIKKKIDTVEYSFLRVRQMVRRAIREQSKKNSTHGNRFAVLVVKRIEYLDLAIENINSLHFHNSSHKIRIYADGKIFHLFQESKKKLHYPEMVECVNFFPTSVRQWQMSKVRALIDASKNEFVLMDADGIWRSDPYIDTKKVMFLVKAYPFDENTEERELLRFLRYKGRDPKTFHYVTGFLSIPKSFLTKELEADCLKYCSTILKVAPNDRIYRLAEEIALSLSIQKHVAPSKITTLKQSDGPGDRRILQSMYYGCMHTIND